MEQKYHTQERLLELSQKVVNAFLLIKLRILLRFWTNSSSGSAACPISGQRDRKLFCA